MTTIAKTSLTNAVSGKMGEGGAGNVRADFVLGDRDGTTCGPGFTECVRAFLAGVDEAECAALLRAFFAERRDRA